MSFYSVLIAITALTNLILLMQRSSYMVFPTNAAFNTLSLEFTVHDEPFRCPSLNQESFMHQETSMSNWRTAMLLTSYWYSSISYIPCSSAGRRISGFRLRACGIMKRQDSSARSHSKSLHKPYSNYHKFGSSTDSVHRTRAGLCLVHMPVKLLRTLGVWIP